MIEDKLVKDLCHNITEILKDNSKTPLEKNNLIYNKVVKFL